MLVARQREWGGAGGIFVEGRDIGTVVFPDADVKIYLDACPRNGPGDKPAIARSPAGAVLAEVEPHWPNAIAATDPCGIAAGHGAQRDPDRDDRHRDEVVVARVMAIVEQRRQL